MLVSCSSPLLIPNPKNTTQTDEQIPERKVKTREMDFARAFQQEDSFFSDTQTVKTVPYVSSYRYPPFTFSKRPVRVLLRQSLKETIVYSSSSAELRSHKRKTTFRGRMLLQAHSSSKVVASVNNIKKEFDLPCTLFVKGANLLELGEESFRGALIISAGSPKTFSVINLLEVEEYLRGVVPLEIGRLKQSEIEALKAQAVAARTYTYKKMASGLMNPYDLVCTVADQVYGGANVESSEADLAVRATADLVMVYGESIINAYYHSTCGGATANVEDVWGMEPYPYLRSISDVDVTGNPYCSWSRAFSWEESWPLDHLSSLLSRYSVEGKLDQPFKGRVKSVVIRDRFPCGRVKTCSILSSSGEYSCGGDRIRFLVRRNTNEHGILRSAKFQISMQGKDKLVASGSGYGHGVGMCQTGAIGRARAGQNFEQILNAYYSAISIRTISE